MEQAEGVSSKARVLTRGTINHAEFVSLGVLLFACCSATTLSSQTPHPQACQRQKNRCVWRVSSRDTATLWHPQPLLRPRTQPASHSAAARQIRMARGRPVTDLTLYRKKTTAQTQKHVCFKIWCCVWKMHLGCWWHRQQRRHFWQNTQRNPRLEVPGTSDEKGPGNTVQKN